MAAKSLRRRVLKISAISLAAILVLLTGAVYYLSGFWLPPVKGWWANHLASTFRDRPTGEVVFYGASNFRLWQTMETDLAPYRVQNHGIGGSTDPDLIQYADVLLYPFAPSIVFIQTGSNDLTLGLTVEEIKVNKARMYEEFRRRLPETTFVVMSGLPLPGRAQYWDETKQVNAFLADYCASQPKMVFIDATGLLLTADGQFRPDLFISDGIHLTAAGQKLWSGPILEVLADLGAPAN